MAASFDTTDDELNWGNLGILDGQAQVAFSMHIIPRVDGTRRTIWSRFDSQNDDTQFIIEEFSSGDLRLFVSIGGTDNGDNFVETGNSPLTASQFNHVLIQYDGGEGSVIDRVKFYIDDVESTASKSETGTVPTSMVTPPDPENFVFNIDYYNGSTPILALWGGTAGELAIWTGVVLAADERTALKNGTPASKIRHSSLKLDTPLDGAGSTPIDYALGVAVGVTGTAYADHPSMAPRFWGGWQGAFAAAAAATSLLLLPPNKTNVLLRR